MTREEFMIKHGYRSEDRACQSALEWIGSFPHYTEQELWDTCDRHDWMLWYLEKTINRRDTRILSLACALIRRVVILECKTAWDLCNDESMKDVIRTAEKYSTGEATKEQYNIVCNSSPPSFIDIWKYHNFEPKGASIIISEAIGWLNTDYKIAFQEQCNIIREFFPTI